ncbi:hypothetical protein BN889_03625 [Pseudomonas aeruginosa PA38182]|nr:hypothetical protein BN889_03625 [Pseudomonas aeruginosa PA38182]
MTGFLSAATQGNKDDDPTFAIRPAGQAAFPAVLHHPAARRLQRQHLQAVADPRHPLSPQRQRRPQPAGQPLRTAVHPAVLPVLGTGRTVRREVQQGRADARAEAGRGRHHAGRRCRLRLRQPAADVRRAVRHGHPLGAIWPGQVFDPAPAPARGRTGRRQRAGGDGHLPGDPGRHHRRRRADVPCALRGGGGHRGGAGGRLRLPGQPRHSASGGGAAGVEARLEHLRPVLEHPPPGARPAPGGLALAGGQLLVLVPRRGLPDADPDLRQGMAARRRKRGDPDPHRVLGGHRAGLDAVREAFRSQGGDRPGAVRLDRPDRLRHPPLVARRRHSPRRGALRLAGGAAPP